MASDLQKTLDNTALSRAIDVMNKATQVEAEVDSLSRQVAADAAAVAANKEDALAAKGAAAAARLSETNAGASDERAASGATRAQAAASAASASAAAAELSASRGAFAMRGANRDITSLENPVTIATPLAGDVSKRIVNSEFVSLALAAKAGKGSNSDITSLSGLLTPLSLAQGGTGSNTASGARSALGLGSLALQPHYSVSITGGAIAGLSSLATAKNTFDDGVGNASVSSTLSVGGAIICQASAFPILRIFNTTAPAPAGGVVGRFVDHYCDVGGNYVVRFVNGAQSSAPTIFMVSSDANSNPVSTVWSGATFTFNPDVYFQGKVIAQSTLQVSGAVSLGGALGLGKFTVATMPAGAVGSMIFVSNGRKASEAAGAGTGVAAVYSNGAWRRLSDETAVAA